jgi:hypothetical protein
MQVRAEMEFRNKQRIAYDSSNNAEYIGYAPPAVGTDAAKWQIRKVTYSGNYPVAVDWAGGSTNFDKVWDDRESYSYS